MEPIRMSDWADILNRPREYEAFMEGYRFEEGHGTSFDDDRYVRSVNVLEVNFFNRGSYEYNSAYCLGRLTRRGYFDHQPVTPE